LLLLDNFEHLAATAGYLSLLIASAPGLKILVTSRTRLNVRGEQVFLLEGLPFPPNTSDALAWQGYSAVQLFLQTARSVDPAFSLLPEEETREAAEMVADVSLPILMKLVDHSFVRRVLNGSGKSRFEMLEVLRLYAAEQLQQNPTEGALVFDRHQTCFISFLRAREGRLQGVEQHPALKEIGVEIENIRAAWRWSIVQQDVAALNDALKSLFDYYDMQSRFQEGRDAFQRAAETMASKQPHDPADTLVWGCLLARQGWFTFHAGRYSEAERLLQKSVDLIRPCSLSKSWKTARLKPSFQK